MGSPRGRHRSPSPLPRGIHSPRLHEILYSALLIATPFVMLRTFMQDAIGRLSASAFPWRGHDVPVVPVVAALALVALAVALRRRITRRILLALALGLAMIALAQRIADYYYGHRFYELQHNWHYFAYAIFAAMTWRDLRPRGHSLARYLLVTFTLATAYSAFDEGFQLFINRRIFDMGDIAKDAWGALTGMTVIVLARPRPELARGAWRKVRHRRPAAYLSHAPSVWLLLAALALIYLGTSSLLTETRYVGVILLITAAAFGAFFALFHLSQFRWGGRVLLVAAVLAVLAQTGFCIRHRHDQIGRHQYGLTVYRGVPIPFFDVMVFPHGGFRLVDKKHYFNNRDRNFFLRRRPDILLIGAGYRGEGGKGFPHQRGSRFLYNPFSQQGVQVIILDSAQACEEFNRLKAQGKNVLFVLHTTC